jgi:hypothetical protein
MLVMSPTRLLACVTFLGCAVLLGCSHSAKTHVPQNLPAASSPTWYFVVAGDSRNCGDVIMPAIADGARQHNAQFYWHLGDLRKISDIDQDFQQLAARMNRHPSLEEYQERAWKDFIANQILPFRTIPFFIGIGNHETILPKTREEFVTQFEQWLNSPEIKAQRLKDNPQDEQIKTYYHWVRDGIDFVNLDNASWEQFDPQQLKWFEDLLGRDQADATLRTLVVGMHAALPESISANHSMNEWPVGVESGQRVYLDLLKLQNEGHKLIYVLASHSHFFMDGIFNTEYWRTHGGVLPGWIIGTAGAERYPLPAAAKDAKIAKTNVYGYLLATVNPPGQPLGTVQFDFQQIDQKQIPEDAMERFTEPFVAECFFGNRRTEGFPEPTPKTQQSP